MATTIYFIRHGQTPSNKQRIRQGIQIDDYLDTQGILQIQNIVPIIKKLKLDVLYTSRLHRADESVALINQKLDQPIPVIYDDRLKERDFGSLTGKPQEYWDKMLPNNRELDRLQEYDYRPFGGESVEDVRQRVLNSLLDMIANNPGRKIGIIAHNGPIRLVLFHFPEIPRIYRAMDTEKDIANTDIYEWELTEGRLKNLNSLVGVS